MQLETVNNLYSPEAVIEGFRLAPQQRDLWRLLEGSGAYSSQCVLTLEGAVDRKRIKECLSVTVNRHEALRTTFRSLPGLDIPIQVVSDSSKMSFREDDFSGFDNEAQRKRIDEIIAQEDRDAFSYDEGPLVRTRLLTLSAHQHLLVVSLPAMCGDSRSLKNVAMDFCRLYDGLETISEDEPVQYVQFSEWQNELLEGENAEAGMAFWSERAETRIGLPMENSVPPSRSFEPALVTRVVDDDLSERLQTIAGEMGSEEGTFLLACWQTLLWRLSRQDDIPVHAMFDLRKYADLHEAVGLFQKYLPLDIHLVDDNTFGEVLNKTDKSIRAARLWQDYFTRQTPRDFDEAAAEIAACRVGFDYDEWPAAMEARGVAFSLFKQFCCTDRFKIRLSCCRSGHQLRLAFQFDSRLYSKEGIDLLAARFVTLVRSVAADVAVRIDEAEVIGLDERRRLRRVFNQTGRDYPSSRLIHWMIEDQAQQGPDAVAVEYEDSSISYREFNRRANQLAHYLRGKGIGPDKIAGIALDRSIDMIVALVAVWKAGGAYVAIDRGQPKQRIRQVLEDAAPVVVITGRTEGLSAETIGPETGLIELDWSLLGSEATTEPKEDVEAENLAYLIYTSGTTGRPKGVMIEHRSLANLMWALEEQIYRGEEGLRVSVNAPIVFDASVKQLVQLARGRTLIIVPENIRRDGDQLVGFVKEKAIGALDCTPSQLRLVTEGGLSSLNGLKRVLVGGEAIGKDLWRELAGQGQTECWNVYGPSECTVDSTAKRLRLEEAETLGAGIGNVKMYIVDHKISLVPQGMEGEIAIGGAGVGRGYRNSGGRTAEKYVPNPFSDVAGGRLYLSGDIGKWREDGSIEYVGRVDGQVKVRGNRIELGEIESVLREHGTVKEAVVEIRPDAIGEGRLVAYVVPKREYARLPMGGERWKLPNGITIAQDSRNDTAYLYEEIFERRCYMQHGIRLGKKACVFDVGANIGMFSLFMRENYPDARVYAFEPIKPIYEIAKMNMEMYCPQVKLFEVGLSTEEKWEEFTYYPEYSARSGLSAYADAANEKEVVKTYLWNQYRSGVEEVKPLLEELEDLVEFKGEKIRCRLRRLSDVIREEGIERIDLLKVDVQRAELDVLKGIDEEDWEKIDQITMEVHDEEGGASEGRIEEIRRMLEKKGYEVVAEQDDLLVGTDRHNLFSVKRALASEENRSYISELAPNGEGERDRTWTVFETEKPDVGDLTKPGAMEALLRTYARDRLPEYMVPSAIVLIDKCPLTRNGKIDRRALPDPEEVAGQGALDVEESATPYEELLAGIWEDVLRVRRVGSDSNFFDLGGHSLLATQLMSRVRETFAVEIALRELFEEPTVKGLARRIEERKSAGGGVPAPRIVQASRDELLPLSFAQQRLWILDQLEPGNQFYNCPAAVRLEGKLDTSALERVLAEVIRRHEVLRTTFEERDAVAVQVIAPPEEIAGSRLTIIDMTHLEHLAREQEAQRVAEEEARRPFDLSKGPLVRATLGKLAEEEHFLLFTMHHIVSDGWSKAVLVKEVAALYEAYVNDTPSPLTELEIQYADYAAWQRAWLQGEVLDEHLSYWRKQLGGKLPVLELPMARPRAFTPGYRGAHEKFTLPAELGEKIKEFNRREGVTLFMTLMAAFNVLLYRYTGEEDILIGAPNAGRNRREIEGLIGYFINMLAFRSDLSGNPRFVDFLRQVRDKAWGAYAHQDLPFDKLVEELHPDRQLSRTPLVQVTFGFQNAPKNYLELPGLRISGLDFERQTGRFDLTLWMSEIGGQLQGIWTYLTDRFDPEVVRQMSAHLEVLLNSIVERPEARLNALDYLTQAEIEQNVSERRELKKLNRDRFRNVQPKAVLVTE